MLTIEAQMASNIYLLLIIFLAGLVVPTSQGRNYASPRWVEKWNIFEKNISKVNFEDCDARQYWGGQVQSGQRSSGEISQVPGRTLQSGMLQGESSLQYFNTKYEESRSSL